MYRNRQNFQKTNIRMHCVIGGQTGAPLMLFVHGFPEFWYSWRYQLLEFSKEYRTVAADLRGYGESEKPSEISDYYIEKLTDDLDELIVELGYKDCILVAHDWGGLLSWTFTSLHPDRVRRLIVCNCPHPRAATDHMKCNIRGFFASWFAFVFVMPRIPEFLFRTDDMSYLEGLFCGTFFGKKIGAKPGTFDADDIEIYKYIFNKFEDRNCPLNYHRAMVRYRFPKLDTLNVPSLLIWGTADAVLARQSAELTRKYVKDLTVQYIEGISHWVQQEDPVTVNRFIRSFLDDIGIEIVTL